MDTKDLSANIAEVVDGLIKSVTMFVTTISRGSNCSFELSFGCNKRSEFSQE